MIKGILSGWIAATLLLSFASNLFAETIENNENWEFHEAKDGSDSNTVTLDKPFLSIQQAAKMAQPGNVITVHEGVYRERVNPPRGGSSPDRPIVYRAAPGENVVIKGSELI